MGEKSNLKEYVCLANISVKGESGVKFVKDEFYTAEEVRRSPSDKKHKFARLETIRPEAIDGSKEELQALVQFQQIRIQTLEAALAEYKGVKSIPEQPKGKAITSATGGQKPDQKL